ncbi:TIGR01244 family protein [Thioclava sp. SK-1]|uniref:TIGR01244 family sulfur transferase n=1 Tax=Thioclava sp. SK-1 TaxID=1889770 RepID=UPI0008268973|nr:TIGR01244 family sulfur transferase [Thioclava sp. SK-1]OCX63146.1 TIGR01244 family protein [Thioclava sp. SK-1]
MDIRYLSSQFAVSPQIDPSDIDRLVSEGFRTVIINRPDEEILPDQQCDAVADAAKSAGLSVHYLPFYPGEMTQDLVQAFEAVVAQAQTPIFAYCRSGTRSSHLWAMSRAGTDPIESIVAAGAAVGYDLAPMAPLLTSYAAHKQK